jgi:hypothetical protein
MALVIFVAASSIAVSQQRPQGPAQDADLAWQDFRRQFDPGLRASWNFATGYVREIFGRPMDLTQGNAPSDYAELVLTWIDLYPDLFGVSSEELVLRKVQPLDLSQIQTRSKVVVQFDQVSSGMNVEGGHLEVLFLEDGPAVSICNETLPGADELDLLPAVSEDRAMARAQAAFEQQQVEIEVVELAIVSSEDHSRAVLAWKVQVSSVADDSSPMPVREILSVDASSGQVLRRRSLIHPWVDLQGNTQLNATPGLVPDRTGNGPQLFPGDTVTMKSSLGDMDADANGDWTIPFGGVTAQNVTADLSGQSTHVRVRDRADTNISVTQSVTPGTPASFVLNAVPTEFDTAEVNAHRQVMLFKNFIKALDPSEQAFDFQVVCNVNIAGPCIAFYDGSSVQFSRAGNPCPNLAYSTIVAHELGHWANDRFGRGNTPDGYGEGSADVWGMYVHDAPNLGLGFFGPGTSARTGHNNVPYCGSCGAGCYGDIHSDGLPLMGAFWKMRENLNLTLGDAMGDLVADRLFLAWYQTYRDDLVCPTIRDHLLLLDDDDGNLENGTPHGCDIDAGFVQHQFPGFYDQLVVHHGNAATTQAAHSWTEVRGQLREGGCGVSFSLDRMELYFSVNDGPVQQLSMEAAGGGEFSAWIPPQTAPSVIKYHIEAHVGGGAQVARSPLGAPQHDRHVFYVGDVREVMAFDFEEATDQGWTHQATQGFDDWFRWPPSGGAGDPDQAYSGTRVWANDPGLLGSSGDYPADSTNRLISPVFDFSAEQGLRLQFRRWLTVQDGAFDQARLLVNGTEVFANPVGEDLLDQAWTLQDYDISALADGQSAVQFIFELQSDSTVQYGGWTLDDVRILTLTAGPTDCASAGHYGAGTPGSGGFLPRIYSTGGAPHTGSLTFAVTGEQMLGGTTAFLLAGLTSTSVPFAGTTLLVDLNAGGLILPFATSGLGAGVGQVQVPLPLLEDPIMHGLNVFLQWIVIDAGAGGGFSASRGLQGVVCDG